MMAFLAYLFHEICFYIKLSFDVAACIAMFWGIFCLIDEALCSLLFRGARYQAAGWRFMLILAACIAGFRSAPAVWCKNLFREIALPSRYTGTIEKHIGNILGVISVVWVGYAIFRLIQYIRRRNVAAACLSLLPDAPPDAAFDRAARETGAMLKRKVWDKTEGISVFGVFNPVIIVPDGFARRYTDNDRYYLYLHELMHVLRHDTLIHLLTDVCEIIFWIFPPITWEMRRQREYRELCCDKAVLKHVAVEAVSYGELLLREVKTANNRLAVGFSSQRYIQVRTRIETVIGNTKILSAKKLAAYLACCILLIAQFTPVSEMPYRRIVSVIATDGSFNTLYYEEGEVDRQDREQLIERVYADYDKRDIAQIVTQYPKFHYAGLFGFYLSSDNEKLLPE